MTDFGRLSALFLASYALGCIVGAYYLVRWRTGNDLRAFGSGNAGAMNASRVLGRGGFAVSLLIDAGKGALATWIGLQLGAQPLAVVLAMAGVVAGHIWPAQLGFRGGKGAATALGIMIVFDPVATAILLGAGSLMLLLTRRFTLSGLAAIALAPVAAGVTEHGAVEIAGLGVIAAMIVYAHRSNLMSYLSTRDDMTRPLHHEPTR